MRARLFQCLESCISNVKVSHIVLAGSTQEKKGYGGGV